MSQAREIAEQLDVIRGYAKLHPNGAHGQIIGQETWRITLSGNDLQVITDAADKLIELEQQREPCRRCAAFEGLTKAQEAQITNYRKQADKYREAIATLGSEREANELLTARIAALESNLNVARGLLGISETDAERYREIRSWRWYESEAAVVHSPKASVKLGSVCLSHEFLDDFVDQKLARRQEGEQGQKT